MSSDAVERLKEWQGREVAFALIVPLGSALLAFLAWAISVRLQFYGPFDPATFSLAVIAPLWLGGAVVTGWLWSFLAVSVRLRLAAAVWVVEAAVVAATTWFVVVTGLEVCQAGPRSTPVEFLLPALIIGVITGAMPSIAGFLAARRFETSRPAWALVVTLVTFVVGVALFAMAFTWMAFGYGGCNRP